MKKIGLIFRYATSSLVALVALVFTVLELTLIVTLDFYLYENQLIVFIQLILRLLLASGALAVGVLAMVKRTRSFLPHSIFLLVSSVVMIPFVSNHIAIYFAAISALFMLSECIFLKLLANDFWRK
jgi:hypothetical protein